MLETENVSVKWYWESLQQCENKVRADKGEKKAGIVARVPSVLYTRSGIMNSPS